MRSTRSCVSPAELELEAETVTSLWRRNGGAGQREVSIADPPPAAIALQTHPPRGGPAAIGGRGAHHLDPLRTPDRHDPAQHDGAAELAEEGERVARLGDPVSVTQRLRQMSDPDSPGLPQTYPPCGGTENTPRPLSEQARTAGSSQPRTQIQAMASRGPMTAPPRPLAVSAHSPKTWGPITGDVTLINLGTPRSGG
jgi:hypothetical protein